MSRRSRLHVPGGIYYVVQRNNARQQIFTEASDYPTFAKLLAASLSKCRARVHAYCWQPQAIHLVVQVSDLPLGRLMQRLTSQYARAVHRRAGELGHLFQQRYHALLIDPDAYLLKLIQYVHTLPMRAVQVADAGGYPMSSHPAYAGATRIAWLTTADVLRLLGPGPDQARAAYRILMSAAPGASEGAVFERGGIDDPRVLGEAEFMAGIPRHARVYRTSCSLEQVIDTVVRTLGLERGEVLSRSRQRRHSMARALIAWYATERSVATLAQVARRLQRDPSTLFVAVERYRLSRPELFNLAALHDSGPLLPRAPSEAN